MTDEGTSNLEFEREKLELEREKVKLERFKTWWTGIAIIIPLVVAIVTIGFTSQSQHDQAKLQLELQTQEAKTQFELKAAEIVMNTESPLGAQIKAKALASLFPDRLPKNFAASFDPNLYSKPAAVGTQIPGTGAANGFTNQANWNKK